MREEEARQMFRETGALLEGHFILSSGRHSATYFQCARVLQYPKFLTRIAREIVDHFSDDRIDTVISPAIGGIVIGTEVGRQLGVKTIFAERKDGVLVLRRGFTISGGENILIVEDVITTGGSVKEVMDLCRRSGARIVGIGVVVDRSDGKAALHENQFAVTRQSAVSYAAEEIPEWLSKLPAEKPGSRSMK